MAKKKRRRGARILTALLIAAALLALAAKPAYRHVMTVLYPQKYGDLVTRFAGENGLDPALVFAVVKCESSFDKDAVSKIGALGLMQITPPTFAWIQTKTPEKTRYASAELYKPEINIRYGTLILSTFLAEFGEERTALAAYHAGRGNVNKWLADPEDSKDGKTLSHIPFADTRAYVNRVEETKKTYAWLYYKNSK